VSSAERRSLADAHCSTAVPKERAGQGRGEARCARREVGDGIERKEVGEYETEAEGSKEK